MSTFKAYVKSMLLTGGAVIVSDGWIVERKLDGTVVKLKPAKPELEVIKVTMYKKWSILYQNALIGLV